MTVNNAANSSKQRDSFMQRCLDLAALGLGKVAPNPLVGSIIVHNGKIIGEGYHQLHGEAHAEINALASVQDKSLLKDATLYVNLEPCAHHGKTPPCADSIIEYNIPKVVIGTLDPFEHVNGKGVKRLRNSGCEVEVGVLEQESWNLNRRFFTFHSKKRPYVILKWAQSSDGFIDKHRNELNHTPTSISSASTKAMVHKWRSEEQAIMVGTNTASLDNPKLNIREWNGKDPIRVVIDRSGRLPSTLHLFDGAQSTLVFTEKKKENNTNLEFITADFSSGLMDTVLSELYQRDIQSIIVEGGTKLLQSYINAGLWDEARILTNSIVLNDGIKAPVFEGDLISEEIVGEDKISLFHP